MECLHRRPDKGRAERLVLKGGVSAIPYLASGAKFEGLSPIFRRIAGSTQTYEGGQRFALKVPETLLRQSQPLTPRRHIADPLEF